MKKVKAFFYILKKSLIPERKYYQQLIKTPFKFSLKYFFILIFLLNLILLIYLMKLYSYQKVYRLLSNLKKSLEVYPSDLTIFINNNSLFTNNNRPYFLWLKDENKKLLLSVIETADKKIVDELHSIIIITKEQIVIKNPNNYQIISTLKNNEIPKTIIDKKLINNLVQNFQLLLNNLHWIYLLIVFSLFLIFPLVSFLATSFYLLLASFLVFSYFKIFKKRRFHFKKVFQISLHTVTFPLLIEYLAIIFPTNFLILRSPLFISSPLTLFFLIITLFTLFTAIGVLEAYNNHQK